MLPLRRTLNQTAAVVALSMLMPALSQAQLTGMNFGVEAGWSSGSEDWNTQATAMVPLLNNPVSMLYTMARVGMQHKDPHGSVGFGYRHFFEGGFGAGVYGSFDAQRTEHNKRFQGFTTGIEVFIPGGVAVSTNIYVPVGDKNKVVGGTTNSGVAVLKDQPGSSGSCNPANPARVCSLVVDGRKEADIERNRLGIDLTVSYETKIGNILFNPFITGYLFERDSSSKLGLMVGADVGVPITSGLTLTGGGRIRYDREEKTDVLLGIGLNIQFGGVARANSQTAMHRLPRRLPDHMRVQQDKGQTFSDEPVIWDRNTSGQPVSEVRFVNAANQNNAATIVANTQQSGIVVFDGNIALPNATLNIMNNSVGLISGGTQLNLTGAVGGNKFVFTAPGTRGTITQNNAVDVIRANNKSNPILENLTLRKGMSIVVLDTTSRARLIGLDLADSTQDTIFISNSDFIQVSNLKIDKSAASAVRVNASANLGMMDIDISNTNNIAIHLDNVQRAQIIDFNINKTTTGRGVFFESSKNIVLERGNILDTANNQRAISTIGGSDIMVKDVVIRNAYIGVEMENTANVQLTNLEIRRMASVAGSIGVSLIGGSSATYTNVSVVNYRLGYG
ncbi:MAG: right-handed parallel beta-helix repeat-containing protein, partial [Alphaproteobacteria bacterium]|nr:right-handed parallel beta-helix repeat-containing protein [Alphaproteobacteria bacterium]